MLEVLAEGPRATPERDIKVLAPDEDRCLPPLTWRVTYLARDDFRLITAPYKKIGGIGVGLGGADYSKEDWKKIHKRVVKKITKAITGLTPANFARLCEYAFEHPQVVEALGKKLTELGKTELTLDIMDPGDLDFIVEKVEANVWTEVMWGAMDRESFDIPGMEAREKKDSNSGADSSPAD